MSTEQTARPWLVEIPAPPTTYRFRIAYRVNGIPSRTTATTWAATAEEAAATFIASETAWIKLARPGRPDPVVTIDSVTPAPLTNR